MSDFNEEWVHTCAQQIVTEHVKAALSSHAQAGKPIPPPDRALCLRMYQAARVGVIAELKRRRGMGFPDPKQPPKVITTVTKLPEKPSEKLVQDTVVEDEPKQHQVDRTAEVDVMSDEEVDVEEIVISPEEEESLVDHHREDKSAATTSEAVSEPVAGVDTVETVEPLSVDGETDDEDITVGGKAKEYVNGGIMSDADEVIDKQVSGRLEHVAVVAATVREVTPAYDKVANGEDVPDDTLCQDDILKFSDNSSLAVAVEACSNHSRQVSGLDYEKPVCDIKLVVDARRDNHFVMSDPAIKDPMTAAFKRWRSLADGEILLGTGRLRHAIRTCREYTRMVWHRGRVICLALLVADGVVMSARAAELRLHPLDLDPHGYSDRTLKRGIGLMQRNYPRMEVGFSYVRRHNAVPDTVVVMIPCGRLITPVGPFQLKYTPIGWCINSVLPPNAAGAPLLSVKDGAVVGQVGDMSDDDDIADGLTRVLTSWETYTVEERSGYDRCGSCGFVVNRAGHEQRCVSVPQIQPSKKVLYRRRAWVGDMVYMRIVRFVILQSELPIKEHTIRSAELCSAKTQRMLYEMYGGDKWEVLSTSDHAYSTALEATLVDDLDLVTFVLDWVGRELNVDTLVDPSVFMPTVLELEAAAKSNGETSAEE